MFKSPLRHTSIFDSLTRNMQQYAPQASSRRLIGQIYPSIQIRQWLQFQLRSYWSHMPLQIIALDPSLSCIQPLKPCRSAGYEQFSWQVFPNKNLLQCGESEKIIKIGLELFVSIHNQYMPLNNKKIYVCIKMVPTFPKNLPFIGMKCWCQTFVRNHSKF